VSSFSGQVSQSTDDGFQAPTTGTVTLTGASAILDLSSGSSSWLAVRFQNVTVPPGATISAATLSLWATTAKNISSVIYGNKVANPSTLTTTTNYLSGLARTTASVSWSASSMTAGAFSASPDISAIITELIGQAGWASGNSIILILENSESASLAVTVEMYDGSPSEAAELSVTYTGGSVPGAPTIALANDATNPTTAIDITITAGTGSPTGYDIQQAPTKGGTFSTIATNVSSPYTVSSLTPGTEYAFQVAGVNGSGVGSYCSPVASATEAAAPTSLSASVWPTSAVVAFTGASVGTNVGVYQYVYRYETPVGAGNWVSSGGGYASPVTVSGLNPLTQYGIEVATVIQSLNGDFAGTIQGPWSSELTVNTQDDGRHQQFTDDASGMFGTSIKQGCRHIPV
jgi:Fibronectin type III domain